MKNLLTVVGDGNAAPVLDTALRLKVIAKHGAGETTKLLAVKSRLRCTRCGRQCTDLKPDWSQRSAG